MNSRQRKTLEAIFPTPVPKNLRWDDIESLLIAVGCKMKNRSGSKIGFAKGGLVLFVHRPHQQKEAAVFNHPRRQRISRVHWSDTMTNTIEYKGYTALVEYSAEDKLFFGRVLGIEHIISFGGTSIDEIHANFMDLIDDYSQITCITP